MIQFTLKLTGTAALLMASNRLADPLDPLTKELKTFSDKRKKTDEDIETILHLKYLAAFYVDETVGPYLPSDNVFKSLIEGARLTRDGAGLERALILDYAPTPLGYAGPRDIRALWDDKNFVFRTLVNSNPSKGKKGGRIPLARPRFEKRTASVTGVLDDSVFDLGRFRDIAATAGAMIGVGDWRPKFGRYTTDLVA